jgi:hypothetical protein
MLEVVTDLGPRIKNLSEGNLWALAMLFRPDYPRDYSRRPKTLAGDAWLADVSLLRICPDPLFSAAEWRHWYCSMSRAGGTWIRCEPFKDLPRSTIREH